MERVYRQLGITVHNRDWLCAEDRAQDSGLRPVSPWTACAPSPSAASRSESTPTRAPCCLLATDNLEHELEAMPVVKRYDACRQTLSDIGATDRDGISRHPVLVNGGGVYLPWGIVAEVSRPEKVHVSTWNVAYRKRRFIFCHDDT